MQSLTIALFAVLAIGYTVGFPSELSQSPSFYVNEFPESRNFFQQLLINQIVNVLPANIRDQIDNYATLFGMVRHEFLLRALKELQAFQAYSKIDFITAIQKTIKFADEEITREQEKQLESLEEEGIQLATLLFANKLQAGELNPIYDLLVKIVRRQIDGAGVVDQLPKLVKEILANHA